MTFHIDNDGSIRNVVTGQLMSAGQAVAAVTLPGPAIIVGIIIGTGIGAGAAAVSGQSASQIFLAGYLGGIAGYWGGLAALTTGVVRVMYGTSAIVFGGPVATLGTQGPAGGCSVATQGGNCLIKTK